MTGLNATFQPQQWINDHAVDSGAAVGFDAAPAVIGLSLPQLRRLHQQILRTSGRDLDILAENSGLIGAGEDRHDGPFYVDVDEQAFAQFLAELGVSDVLSLTEDEWAAIKSPSSPALR